ncbi:hypothetical protein DFJ73DRAFT_823457 [Zopfochytrium polystomum]|nr:hypothetical protein DFJ73DRAFT_823457 [Zopfochytrium polystomum]
MEDNNSAVSVYAGPNGSRDGHTVSFETRPVGGTRFSPPSVSIDQSSLARKSSLKLHKAPSVATEPSEQRIDDTTSSSKSGDASLAARREPGESTRALHHIRGSSKNLAFDAVYKTSTIDEDSVVVPISSTASHSVTASQSVASQALGNVRVVTETVSTVIYEGRWSMVSLVLNIILIALVSELRKSPVLPVDAEIIQHYGGVTLEIVLLYSNILTMTGLKHGASAVFGCALASKKGFSLAACGFLQTPSLRKYKFAQSLSLTSPSRRILERISFIWIAVELLKLITPFCAIALYAKSQGSFNDMSDCVYFVQDDRFVPVDRKWPTMEVEAGVSEYVFGTSLGVMRSEVADVNVTVAMFPPSLISALNDGDIITGPGFTAEISTVCHCATGITPSDIANAGVHPSQAAYSLYLAQNSTSQARLTFGVISQNQTLQISNILAGSPICGGDPDAGFAFPVVCSTTISNHRSAELQIMFRTDGTTASIAADTVQFISDNGPSDIDNWLAFAFTKLVDGPVSAFTLPPQVPGSLNPLLWWTSPNLISVDRALLESGVETMYAILFKAAIQRSYVARATQCPRMNVLISHRSSITIKSEGIICAMLLLTVQVIVSACSVAMFGLWIISPYPIGPAVRATREFVYFLVLFSSSNLAVNTCELGNGSTYAIWQELDVVARIGESIHSLDQLVGQLVVDKPSMVRAMKNGRKYM